MLFRYSRTATFILSALFSTGLAIAQAQPQQPSPDNSGQTLGAQTAPDAQGRQHRADPNRQARRLAKELNLSRDQVAQIKPILVDRVRQMQALLGDSSLAPADRRSKAQAIQQDSKAKIEALLNDTQKQQFEQLQAQRRARRHQPQTDNQPGL